MIKVYEKEADVTEKTTKKEDRSTWIIGGGLLMGMGVGFFFLHQNPLAFVGSMFVGLGLGLVFATLVSRM
jgi:hypothetical protein